MLSPMILNINQMQNLWKTFTVPGIHELTVQIRTHLLVYLKLIKKVKRSHGGVPTFLYQRKTTQYVLSLTAEI